MAKNRLGFTLIEIIIVVGIIVATFTVSFIIIRGSQTNTVKMELVQIAEAMNEYRMNTGSYPTASNFQNFLNDSNYFKTPLKNPFGNGFGMIDNGTTITIYANPQSMGISYTFQKSQMGVQH
jgi:prepilin-type N-terminal cleavage/methylation domain-containing protein